MGGRKGIPEGGVERRAGLGKVLGEKQGRRRDGFEREVVL